MAVKLRLRRTGAKKQPRYRIVAADSRSPRDGRFIEVLGHYNPTRQPHEVVINEEMARKWLKAGAQPTDTVRDLLVEKGLLSPAPEAPARQAAAGVAEAAPSVAEAPAPEPAPSVAEAPAPEPVAETASEAPAPDAAAATATEAPAAETPSPEPEAEESGVGIEADSEDTSGAG
jgi:small subunit ribosomal protein S16